MLWNQTWNNNIFFGKHNIYLDSVPKKILGVFCRFVSELRKFDCFRNTDLVMNTSLKSHTNEQIFAK